jgi:uncharacterized membrane protein YidH (DUF202 family)
MAKETGADILRGQRDELRKKLEMQNRGSVRPAALGLFAFGVALLAFWLATRDGSTQSSLLLLAGLTAVAIAILLYYLSPSRFLRDDVADALAVTGVLDLGRILSSLLIEGRGIYVPASEAGRTKVFVPVAEAPAEIPLSGGIFVSGAGKGILLDPPGYGLLACSRLISPALTEEGLENEIADILENGLELARKVTVTREGNSITVSMADLANAGLCSTVRKENPRLCTQLGCPICSFTACMVADGLRRRVRIEEVEVRGKVVKATFRLL